jgi:hypothetical protein
MICTWTYNGRSGAVYNTNPADQSAATSTCQELQGNGFHINLSTGS